MLFWYRNQWRKFGFQGKNHQFLLLNQIPKPELLKILKFKMMMKLDLGKKKKSSIDGTMCIMDVQCTISKFSNFNHGTWNFHVRFMHCKWKKDVQGVLSNSHMDSKKVLLISIPCFWRSENEWSMFAQHSKPIWFSFNLQTQSNILFY